MGRILSLFALVLIAACAQPTAPAHLATIGTDPFIRGVITAEQQGGFLVEARNPGAYEVDAAVVRPTAKTKVQGADATWESLAVGQTVSVWITGPVLESLPVQVFADVVVVE